MFKKQIKHLSLGGAVFGLSEDLFALFLNSFMQINEVGAFLFVSDDDVFNKDQSVRSVFSTKRCFIIQIGWVLMLCLGFNLVIIILGLVL